MIIYKRIKVTLELLKQQLGTNPVELDVMDKHILDRQRKLIAEQSNINKAINKYLKAKQISVEKGEAELIALARMIEELMGRDLEPEEYEGLKLGKFKTFEDLKETMMELEKKGITCFFRDAEGRPCIGNHMILGYLKAAAERLCRNTPAKKGAVLSSLTHTVSMINQYVSVEPDFIPASLDLVRDEEGKPKYLQRSLRAKTAQGPRISLAKSELLPAGTRFDFELEIEGRRVEEKGKLIDNFAIEPKHLYEMFKAGRGKGLGQWRNVGNGKFEIIKMEVMPTEVLEDKEGVFIEH